MAGNRARSTTPVARWLSIAKAGRYYTLGPDNGAGVREVWFVLHGYGQLAASFIQYFGDLDDGTRRIIAPEALNRFYLVTVDSAPASERPVGATWMTREDREHEIADYVAYLDALHGTLVNARSLAPKVVVIGFSQGAATAARWAERGTARIDHLVLWGGTVPPETEFTDGSNPLRGVPVTLVVGSRDQYMTPEVIARERLRFDNGGVPFRFIGFEGGHVVSRAAIRQLVSLLNEVPGR